MPVRRVDLRDIEDPDEWMETMENVGVEVTLVDGGDTALVDRDTFLKKVFNYTDEEIEDEWRRTDENGTHNGEQDNE